MIAYAFMLGFRSVGLLSRARFGHISSAFAVFFVAEVILCMVNQGAGKYWQSKWHIADVVLAGVLFVESFMHAEALSLPALRVGLGILRISSVFEIVLKSPAWLQRLAGVAIFVALSAELKFFNIQSVVGMLGIFGVLLTLRQIGGPERAAVLYKVLDPGKTFLVKWATLFFVPALVRLPLVAAPGGADLLRLAVVLVAGYAATLTSTVAVAGLFPERAQDLAEETPKPVADTPKPAGDDRPFKRRLLSLYISGLYFSALAARYGFGVAKAQTVWMLSASLLGFVGGMLLPSRVKKILHPMFVCIASTWAAAGLWGLFGPGAIGFKAVLQTFVAPMGAGALLTTLLSPVLLALGLLLFERRRMLARELLPIATTSVASALLSVFGSAAIARVLGLKGALAASTLTRSISTPFASDLTGLLGASSTFAIALIVLTGFLGVISGGPIFSALRVRSARTRGLAMGASAHALGTVAMAESDKEAFPYSALSLLCVGTSTSIVLQLAPVRALLFRIILS